MNYKVVKTRQHSCEPPQVAPGPPSSRATALLVTGPWSRPQERDN